MKTSRLLCVALLVACQSKPAAESQPAPAAPAPAAPAPAAPAQVAAPAAAPAPNAPPLAGGLTWQDAEPLVRRTPKSAMRAAEYGVTGDEGASLTVFYFGPDQGGSVEANVARWLGQFTQPDGSDTAAKAVRSKREVGGIPVALVEVSGNFAGGMSMTADPAPAAQPDTMLLGAIASGPSGPVFFKLTGKHDAIEHARPAFEQLIGSLHAASK